jgi:hypothetical protein
MLIYFLIAGLTALVVTAPLCVIIRNLLHKNDTYEKWIIDFKQDVNDTYAIMRAIDEQGTFATRLNDKGVFESDDQVGAVFKELADLILKLNERTTDTDET